MNIIYYHTAQDTLTKLYVIPNDLFCDGIPEWDTCLTIDYVGLFFGIPSSTALLMALNLAANKLQ